MASNKDYSDMKSGGRGNNSKMLTENKTTQVLQTIYTLNKSGTKRVTLGLESAMDFEPILHLHKTGFDGVRLSCASWQQLLNASTYISSFFNGQVSPSRLREEIFISTTEKINFRQQYSRYLISITSTFGDKQEVVLAETTWKRLLELTPLISYNFANLIIWQSDAMEMFTAFAKAVKAKIPVHGPAAHHPTNTSTSLEDLVHRYATPDNVTSIVKCLEYTDLNFCPKNGVNMDIQKCFFELQAFCANEIMCYVAFV